MYTLLISEDNSVTTSVYEPIMQRSLNVDNIQILVNRDYKGIDLSNATVLMEYVLPSKRIFSTYLNFDGNYSMENFIKYTIPANTMLTAEAGDILVSFTFVKTELDENNNPKAYVRKTQAGIIKITPISHWLDFIPDEHLTAIDQRLLAMEAAQKSQDSLNQEMFEQMARDITLDEEKKKILLESNSGPIGNGIDTNKLSEIIGSAIVGQDLDGVNDGVTHLDNIPDIQIVSLDSMV